MDGQAMEPGDGHLTKPTRCLQATGSTPEKILKSFFGNLDAGVPTVERTNTLLGPEFQKLGDR